MKYSQTSTSMNSQYRDDFVVNTLQQVRAMWEKPSLLDVGAGLKPYSASICQLGYTYSSHDFAGYFPNLDYPGLHDESWDYPEHSYKCDILELKPDVEPEVILCTEVLEHVPDPVRALEHMAKILRPGGRLIITVPFLSLMHQAPHWFQSGLSPFWFEYWSRQFGMDVEHLEVYGDYADFMQQESRRLIGNMPVGGGVVIRLARLLIARLRKHLPQELLESGGFGTLYVATKGSIEAN